MLDIATLGLVYAAITTTTLVLFYTGTYRNLPTSFGAWWCRSLVCSLVAIVLWQITEPALQRFCLPIGNGIGVLGGLGLWMAARSDRIAPPPRLWPLLLVPATVVAAALDEPSTDIWAGGVVSLTSMSIALALTTRELWLGRHARRQLGRTPTAALIAVTALMSVFYLCRAGALVVVGPDSALFVHVFGYGPTVLIMLILVLTVTNSLGALTNAQVVQELRLRADRDDLTGLLNRSAFWTLSQRELVGVTRSAVIVADLDRFKQVNDDFGHSAGDQVLVVFADMVRRATRSTDLLARFGGEEFVILLPGATVPAAAATARAISGLVRENADLPDRRPVTVSFGICAVDGPDDLLAAVDRADSALYAAKGGGRDRLVVYPSMEATSLTIEADAAG